MFCYNIISFINTSQTVIELFFYGDLRKSDSFSFTNDFTNFLVASITVWVGRLPKNFNPDTLYNHFHEYAEVKKIDVSFKHLLFVTLLITTAGCYGQGKSARKIPFSHWPGNVIVISKKVRENWKVREFLNLNSE